MDNKIQKKDMYSLTKEISDKNLYESNNHLCDYCKQKYHNQFLDKYYCHYCGKHFCSNHRIPEYHDCQHELQKLKSPPKEIAVTYDGETMIVQS